MKTATGINTMLQICSIAIPGINECSQSIIPTPSNEPPKLHAKKESYK